MICHLQWFRDLERWIPGGDFGGVFEHPMVPLEDLLKQRQEKVTVREDLGDWQPITIHFDGSVDARQRTAIFKGHMFAAFPGDLVFSKIDLRNGAITVIPQEFPKVVVTSEYPIHIPDREQVDGDYLRLILRTPEFLYRIKQASSGTSGRKRITPEDFRAFEVPLPDPPHQRRLVAAYNRALDKARKLEAEAEKIEKQAVREFEAALGLVPPPDLPHRPFQIARFKEVDRWSHEGILARATRSEQAADFPVVRLGDVIDDLVNGWSPQCESRQAKEGEWGVLKVGAVSLGRFQESQNKALPSRLKPRPALEVRCGDVLISRANITRLVGACALIQQTRPRLLLCDKLFRVVFQSNSPITAGFLNEVMKLGAVRQQIESQVTGTSPTMKNISKPSLLDITFPLPPDTRDQSRLVDNLAKARDKARQRLLKASAARATAWQDFINSIFS
jgi:type I restriction enzyme S subunit